MNPWIVLLVVPLALLVLAWVFGRTRVGPREADNRGLVSRTSRPQTNSATRDVTSSLGGKMT